MLMNFAVRYDWGFDTEECIKRKKPLKALFALKFFSITY
jgi:hypothetical protein